MARKEHDLESNGEADREVIVDRINDVWIHRS